MIGARYVQSPATRGSAITPSEPSLAQSRQLLQREIVDCLRTLGPQSYAELAKRCRRERPAVRAEVSRLRAAGWPIETEGGVLVLAGPQEKPRCGACGAVLRRGNDDGYCSPCIRAGRGKQAEKHDDHRTKEGRCVAAALRDALLRILKDGAGERVSPYAALGLDSHSLRDRHRVGNAVQALRKQGHDIRGHRGGGWSWHPSEESPDA